MDFFTIREIFFPQSFQKRKENVIRTTLEFSPSMIQMQSQKKKKNAFKVQGVVAFQLPGSQSTVGMWHEDILRHERFFFCTHSQKPKG